MGSKKSQKALFVLGLTAVLSSTSNAQSFSTGKAFDLTIGVGSVYQSSTDTISGGIQASPVGFSTVINAFDSATTAGFSKINSAYTATSASVIRLGYRGLPLLITTDNASAAITFLVPSINQNKIFSARTTRDGNIEDLRDFLKNSGTDLINQLNQKLAQSSPVDPIAGNPNSLQSQMVGADFDRNFIQSASNIKESSSTSAVSNLIGAGVSFGSFSQGGLTNQAVTLPLSYTFRSQADARRQLTIYAPISVTTVAGAKSYAVNLGASYRFPVNNEWAITPGLGYGIAGSIDLGSAASMSGASVTNQYTLRQDGYDLAFGNTVGLYQSRKISLGGYSFDPSIKNTVFRNGILLSVPTVVLGQKMAYELSLINTLYAGTGLYSRQYNELGFTLGTNKSADSTRSYLRGGLSYLQGQNGIRGFKANLGYWF